MPLRQHEVDSILNQIQEKSDTVAPAVTFEIGETVKINEGPFQNFSGIVEEVDADRFRLKVTVSIFGRDTLVELDYNQVEKTA